MLEPNGKKEPDYALTVPIVSKMVIKAHRSIRDLGSEPHTQTVMNAVLMYQLLGVGINETAHILGTSIREVEAIMAMSAYQETFEMLFTELLSASSNSLQARIRSYAGRALDNIVAIADTKPIRVVEAQDDGEDFVHDHYDVPPLVILKANQDLLDRSGMNAEQLYADTTKSDAPGLEIIISTGEEQKTNIKINPKGGR